MTQMNQFELPHIPHREDTNQSEVELVYLTSSSLRFHDVQPGFYSKPYLIVSPPCKVSNHTHVHGVTANLTRLYLHHAKFQIILMYMVLSPPCKVSNPTHVHCVAANVY